MFKDQKPEDSFAEIINQTTKFQKMVGKLSQPTAKAIDYASIPVAAGLGFVLTPSQKMALHILGGTIMGVAGGFGKEVLREERQKAAPSVVAAVLSEHGIASVKPEQLKTIRESFELDDEAWDRVIIEMYKRYLLAMLEKSEIKSSDPKDLVFVADTLGMSGESVSQAHYEACYKMYSGMASYSEEDLQDAYSEAGMKINNFLFLTERVYDAKETLEATIFELSRMQKILNLSAKEVSSRTAVVANKFYFDALQKVPQKLGKVTPQGLEKARQTLGVTKSDMLEMHCTFFQGELLKIVQLKYEENFQNNEISEDDFSHINAIQAALGLEYEIAIELYNEVMTPIYRGYLEKTIETALGTRANDSEAFSIMDLKKVIKNMQINEELQNNELTAFIEESLAERWSEIQSFVEAFKETSIVDAKIEELINAYFAVSSIARQTLSPPVFDRLIETKLKKLLYNTDFSVHSKDKQIYKDFVTRKSGKGNGMSEEDEFRMNHLEFLLGIPEQVKRKGSAKVSTKNLEAKLYELFYQNALNQHNKIELIEQSRDVPDFVQTLHKVGLKLYDIRLRETKDNSRDRIISAKEQDELINCYQWFDLEGLPQLERLHYNVLGDIYTKVALEAMGPAAKLDDESFLILKELGDRLMLTERSQRILFYRAVLKRAEPIVESVLNTWDVLTLSREALARKRGTDYGQDFIQGGAEGSLGIASDASILPDILTLVDFFDDCGITETEEYEVEEYGQKVIKKRYRFPVNVKSQINDHELAKEIYRSFIIVCYTDTNRDPIKLGEVQDKLSGIFGLVPEEVQEIKSTMGGSIVERFVFSFFSNGDKTNFDPSALMFLAQIQTQLRMDDANFDKLIMAAKVKLAKMKAAELFQGSVALTSARCKSFRISMDAMDVDISKDDILSPSSRIQMFAAEMGSAIEGKFELERITEFAQECQSGYKLTEAEAQSALLALMQRRFESLMSVVLKNLKSNFFQRASDGIEKIVNYGLLCPTKISHPLTAEEVSSIISVYDQSLQASKTQDLKEEKMQTLKILLGA